MTKQTQLDCAAVLQAILDLAPLMTATRDALEHEQERLVRSGAESLAISRVKLRINCLAEARKNLRAAAAWLRTATETNRNSVIPPSV